MAPLLLQFFDQQNATRISKHTTNSDFVRDKSERTLFYSVAHKTRVWKILAPNLWRSEPLKKRTREKKKNMDGWLSPCDSDWFWTAHAQNFSFALLISLVVVSFKHSYTDADCNHDKLTVVFQSYDEHSTVHEIFCLHFYRILSNWKNDKFHCIASCLNGRRDKKCNVFILIYKPDEFCLHFIHDRTVILLQYAFTNTGKTNKCIFSIWIFYNTLQFDNSLARYTYTHMQIISGEPTHWNRFASCLYNRRWVACLLAGSCGWYVSKCGSNDAIQWQFIQFQYHLFYHAKFQLSSKWK